jgi:hypothetical protein
MPNNWQKAYDELKDYIAKNPGIEIGMNAVCIAGDVRPEFYRLFDTVRTSFIKDNFSALLETSYALSKNWGEVSQAVKESLKLESIDVSIDTGRFLLDSINGLMHGLFDPLFDLLKGEKGLAAFEQTAMRLVEDEFTKYSREAYQLWATASLLKLLSADRVYNVPTSDYETDESMHPDGMGGSREEKVPDAVGINKISFAHNVIRTFLVPKIIVHSTRPDLFIAFCPDFIFNEGRWRARMTSPEQEWYRISDIALEFGRGKLWPDLAIYTGTHWNGLVMVADYYQIARPDIIVEFREEKGWYEKEGLELVERHYNVLKPKLGSFVVCREEVPEAALKKLESKPVLQSASGGTTVETTAQLALNIHLLSAGYDITKLEPIIESIIKAQTKPEETTIFK